MRLPGCESKGRRWLITTITTRFRCLRSLVVRITFPVTCCFQSMAEGWQEWAFRCTKGWQKVPIMKRFQTKTAAALLIVAGGIIPAYGQGRGNEHGRDRGDRPQQQEQQRGREQQRWQERQAWRQDSRPQVQAQQAP